MSTQNPDPVQESGESTQEIQPKPKKKWAGRIGRFFLNILIVLVIVGGIFVMEALSVIVQVTSFRLYGKRIFRMAPIHHHFELKGWPEPKIIVRFWIISIILALIGLSTLKLR